MTDGLLDADARNLVHEATALGLTLTGDAAAKLVELEALLRSRAGILGLVAKEDIRRLRTRHLLDCLRATATVEPADRLAYDLGSGAGLPGLVVAAAVPRLRVVLVETRKARVAFLELAVDRLGLANGAVAATRIEDLAAGGAPAADLCFARALAPLEASWALAAPLLRPAGRLVYFAGRGAERPIRLAGAASVRVLEPGALESAGPLVIMART